MSPMTEIKGTLGEDEWFAQLRARFLEIARRRVGSEAAEDVVQDALKVVSERGEAVLRQSDVDGRTPLAWCMQVLRNTIGNHYQKQRTRRERIQEGEVALDPVDPSPGPIEALESAEALRLIRQSLEEMARVRDHCARYIRSIAKGVSPRQIAAEERLEEAVIYRRVYRCRQKFRDLLRSRGLEI